MDRFMVATKPHHPSPSLLPRIIQELKLKRKQKQKQQQQQQLQEEELLQKQPQQQQEREQQRVKSSSKSPQIHYENIKLTIKQTQQIHGHMVVTQFDHASQSIPATLLRPQMSPEGQHSFLITSYNANKSPRSSLAIYANLRRLGVQVDCFIIPSVLKACAQCSALELGKEIHGYAFKSGLVCDTVVLNALMWMYGECESVGSARQLFDKMADKDGVSWGTMIRSCARNGLHGAALELLKSVYSSGVRADQKAMVGMAGLFAGIGDLQLGKAMHGYVVRNSGDYAAPVATSLIDMYVKCGDMAYANQLFGRLTPKGLVAWSIMISGLIHHNHLEAGMALFRRMLKERVVPNEIMLLSLVSKLGSVGALKEGMEVHLYILEKRNRVVVSLALATAIVDMYVKCGDLRNASAVFRARNDKDAKIWTTMIAAYIRANCNNEALTLFNEMIKCGIRPCKVMMANMISSCAEVGALYWGKRLHLNINQESLEVDVVLKTALLDMYAKCGDIDEARRLFVEASDRDICMWNAMMTGFALHGRGNEALKLFEEMEGLRIEPNGITFIAVLKACSHSGLVDQGRRLFDEMVKRYGLVPRIEHYGCMVDLLGRAGRLAEAHEFINSMPIEPNVAVWGSLLAACKVHKNLDLGVVAATELLRVEPDKCSYNILMSNIYANANSWDNVAEMRTAMKDSGIKKPTGLSSIEIGFKMYGFVTGDKSHRQTPKIYRMLTEMSMKLKEAGYTPNTSVVFQSIDEEEKETAVKYHSEKLAMAYGLLFTPPGATIRIVKNLRICDDCHDATKLLSKIYGRLIIVRDRNRFHHFSDGSCSCGDFW